MQNDPRKLFMQEVLSRPGYEKTALAEHVFYELCIKESNDGRWPGYVVTQWHGS
jgi:hypothetical protein